MKAVIRVTLVCLCVYLISAGYSIAEELIPCGSFKSVSGQVEILRPENECLKAEAGTRVYPNDRIQSAKDSSASLILQDDTIICLGPDSAMNMDEFVFDPSVYQYSMTTRLIKGTFLFLSGVIAKLAPDHVKIETPDGTIGVRGTRFLVEVTN